jgi:hypothetical protein
MSVHLIPVLIDGELLAAEIARFQKTLPPEEFDSGNSEIHFYDELVYDEMRGITQYAFAKLEPYKNTRFCLDADSIRFQLLSSARIADLDEECRSADALYQFLGAFLLSKVAYNPFNEYGLTASVIIGPANARRLDALFKKIKFASLQPLYNENCKMREDGFAYIYIKSFDDFLGYVKALDGLLAQAIEANKALYMFAS